MMLNLPNSLSLSRIVLLPVVILSDHNGFTALTAACLTLAIISDLVDGPIARRRGHSSAAGTLIDHGSDASFVTGFSLWLALANALPLLLAPLIAIAFVQYLLDALWLRQPGSRPSRLGRFNGIGYYVVCVAAWINLRLLNLPIVEVSVNLLAWTLAVTTVVSILTRITFTVRRIRRF